jgi:hypothetical protein
MLHPAVMVRLLTADRRRGEPIAGVAPGRADRGTYRS